MVFTEIFGTAALTGSGIWGYNRKNFMYDREMRQKQELQVIEMKMKQAELWREDVKDMVGLTEKKMDSYMIVNALQLGFTIALFAEGRLEPGTPQWLLWLYTNSLAGAFMLLIMSVWFAMHASVVATCHCARLLTQFVRLPVPSWEQLESTRTYGYAFEGVPAASMMRVPLLQTIAEGRHAGSGGRSGHADQCASEAAADPWGLERRGDNIYELQRRALPDNRHTRLVREAMQQWQAYDAFARASMSLGTVLLCLALSYYVLGYILIQDGSPWAACAAVMMFLGIATVILRVDLSMTRCELWVVVVFLLVGPVLACIAAAEWATYARASQKVSLVLMPFIFLVHALFLLYFLHVCHVVRQVGGSLLPTSFRSVLYLDIFGWMVQSQQGARSLRQTERRTSQSEYSVQEGDNDDTDASSSNRVAGYEQVPVQEHLVDVDAGIWPSCTNPVIGTTADIVTSSGQSINDNNLPETPRRIDSAFSNKLSTPTGSPKTFGPRHVNFALGNEGSSSQPTPKCERKMRRERLATAHGQNFPRHTLRMGAPRALRPEDVDQSVVTDGDPHGACHALEAAAEHLKTEMQASKERDEGNGHDHTLLPGIGPAGVVPSACPKTFTPKSFAPTYDPTSNEEDGSEAVLDSGRDLFKPGQLPWHVFRTGVLMLVCIWLLGCLWSIAQLCGLPDVRVQVLPEQVAESKSGAIGGVESVDKEPPVVPLLEGGRRISVGWPNAYFQPTGLACDVAGKHFALSDAFDLYFATLNDDTGDAPSTLSLEHPLRCSSLEGHAVEDIAVLCPPDKTESQQSCKVLVLHDGGKQLVECKVVRPDEHLRELQVANATDTDRSLDEASVWTIASQWLRDDGSSGWERITGLAVDGTQIRTFRDLMDVRKSYIVVGTSKGRVLKLRRHLKKDHKLVPAAAIWSNHGLRNIKAIPRSSPLGILPGSYLLMLHDVGGKIQAIDMKTASIVGEWQLPQAPGRKWSGLAGGGGFVYVTSVGQSGMASELWQFPLPQLLKQS